MKERWIEYAKKADFDSWSKALGVSQITARLLRNRDITSLEEAQAFLYGKMTDLEDPFHMKDMEKGVRLLSDTIRAGRKIAVSSDFDDDGIFAGEILYESILNCGGEVKLYTPERVTEGYGINHRIVDEAAADGCKLILTCDNGIAANEAVAYAKSLGFTVVVTDHHEPQQELPSADAIIDPKQKDCMYRFKSLCGAGVAFRMAECLYREFGIDSERLKELYEYAAIATVADVVELKGENRIIVREGLKLLRMTDKVGLRALINACGLEAVKITAYHIGFVIGPCFNAVGRLSNVSMAFRLLQTQEPYEAKMLAEKIRALNETRKAETQKGLDEAECVAKKDEACMDRVLLIRLSDVHESVVGIIAGKIKEKYHRPVFVFAKSGTDAEGHEILKGSGRSVEAYHMLNALLPHAALMERFGGHAMAAGLSVRSDRFELLKKALNESCSLTDTDLTPVVRIDARLPMSALSETLIEEFSMLEPFGTGNPRPIFARPHFSVHSARIIGKNRNVLKMTVSDESHVKREALYFGEVEALEEQVKASPDNIAFTYYPSVNEYMGQKTIQITVQSYCVIPDKSV